MLLPTWFNALSLRLSTWYSEYSLATPILHNYYIGIGEIPCYSLYRIVRIMLCSMNGMQPISWPFPTWFNRDSLTIDCGYLLMPTIGILNQYLDCTVGIPQSYMVQKRILSRSLDGTTRII